MSLNTEGNVSSYVIGRRVRLGGSDTEKHTPNFFAYEASYDNYSDALSERNKLRSAEPSYQFEIFDEEEWDKRFE